MRRVAVALGATAFISGGVTATSASARGLLVIKQVSGSGNGTAGRPDRDFVVLFNRSGGTLSLTGKRVYFAGSNAAYDTAAGTFVTLSGSLAAGQHFLITGADQGNGTTITAGPDATVSGDPLNTSGGSVVITNGAITSPCTEANGCAADQVGYGNVQASQFEGTAFGALAANQIITRNSGGCTDTDSNSADFTASAFSTQPLNSSSTATPCTTAVSWRSGSALARKGGVRVQWTVGLSSSTLGFDVLRVRKGSATRVKVNRALISAAGTKRQFALRDARGKAGDRYYIVERALDGTRTVHGPIVAKKGVAR